MTEQDYSKATDILSERSDAEGALDRCRETNGGTGGLPKEMATLQMHERERYWMSEIERLNAQLAAI